MATPILATKLFIPPPRPKVVVRSRLIERLNEGLQRAPGMTLISAPAGFGKTTLVTNWVQLKDEIGRMKDEASLHPSRVAWLSLDEGDSDPTRFLTYFVAALQTVAPQLGESVLGVLQAPQPPVQEILTTLLNEIAARPDPFMLVLDDYHVVEAPAVDAALAFLLEHQPPQLHLVITTREDPALPLARLRARGQLTELRAADLRFTPTEAAEFLNPVMGLQLSPDDIAALEDRTEGWIAGLQLAALSMQGQPDASTFIQAFTGSHRFVLDYLVEEVLQRQPEPVQTFLLRTSLLNRLCGPLCDAVLLTPAGTGQETLEYIEHANLFIVPMDSDRRWYRYHHLFADLLRQRLRQQLLKTNADADSGVNELHIRASQWYEDNGLELEAFRHAAAAQDVERAERLMEGGGMPLTFRGAAAPVLNWLASLPTAVLDARPSLWVTYASALLFSNQNTVVEPKLQAAEAALQAQPGAVPDDRARDLIGRIAAMRATLAVIQHDVDAIIAQSRRALEHLHPDNLPVRTATTWTLGFAYQAQGNRAAAGEAFSEVIAIGQSSGDSIYTLAATLSLGQIQEANNQLHLAAETYRRALVLAGNPPRSMACEVYLGLARISYEWNDLEAAEQHGQQSDQLARQMKGVDTFVSYRVFLARLRLALGDVAGAAAILDEAEQYARQHGFAHKLPEVAAVQVLALLRQGRPEAMAAATRLADAHNLPFSRARVHLAHGDPASALAVLEPVRQPVEARGWADERLKFRVLQAVALQAQGEKKLAVQWLGDALTPAEPGGFVRTFVDEGLSMAQLLSQAAAQGIRPDYARRLLAAFEAEAHKSQGAADRPPAPSAQILAEPLSQRELEVLRLMAQGLSNREISERLFLALDTVKGHNRKIFEKLAVQRRTEAVARAHELGLL